MAGRHFQWLRLALVSFALLGPAASAQTIEQTVAVCNSSPDPDQKIKACTTAAQSGQVDAPNKARLYVKMGHAYIDKRDFKNAAVTFAQAVQFDPKNAEAYFGLGVADSMLNNNARAITDYSQAIALNPTSGAYSNRAAAYNTTGDNVRALADYDTAIRLNPKLGAAYYNRGKIRAGSGDQKGAVSDFTQAIANGQDGWDSYSRRAHAYHALKDDLHAVPDAEMALQLRPVDHTLYYDACWYRAIIGQDLEKARGNCGYAMSFKQDYAPAYVGRAMVGLKQQRWSDALKDFDSALRLDPGEVVSTYGRGIAKLRLGMTADGQADIAAATKADPRVVASYASYYGVKP